MQPEICSEHLAVQAYEEVIIIVTGRQWDVVAIDVDDSEVLRNNAEVIQEHRCPEGSALDCQIANLRRDGRNVLYIRGRVLDVIARTVSAVEPCADARGDTAGIPVAVDRDRPNLCVRIKLPVG